MPKACLLYEDGLSVGRIAKILSISRTTVYRWIANFAEEKKNKMSAKEEKSKRVASAHEEKEQPIQFKSTKTDGPSPLSNRLESAEEKIARLEKELREARLRADF